MLSSRCLFHVAVALAWFPIATVHAQQELALVERGKTRADADAEHEPGKYTGVTLGGAGSPPTFRQGQSVSVTWPGFQMRPDGGSCVFLQTTAQLSVQTRKSGQKLIVDLGEVSVSGTNRLALDTHFFNTPVTRVELKRSQKRTTLELSLRADAEPRITSAHVKSGYHFLYIDFAVGDYLPAPSAIAPQKLAPPPPSPSTIEEGAAEVQIDAEADLGAAMNDERPPVMAQPNPARKRITISKRAREGTAE